MDLNLTLTQGSPAIAMLIFIAYGLGPLLPDIFVFLLKTQFVEVRPSLFFVLRQSYETHKRRLKDAKMAKPRFLYEHKL